MNATLGSRFLLKESNMPVLRNFPAPTEGLHHVQPNTRVFSESECLGKGTLYVCESTLCWISTSGEGFLLLYPFFVSFAIDSSEIFLKYHGKIVLVEDPNELPNAISSMNVSSADDDEEEEEEYNEIYFVPDDLNALRTMFKAIQHCAVPCWRPEDEGEALEEDKDDE
ncbi:methylosome subunit pICln [Trichonephila clavata]|uniref:Methylosome subunit pICln n=1 Tax=Trichonephila clavata TaxID=2740835 RepID=A0A8X6LUZ6_TRICU|nr:methylosome subunit pICln [Trichonephila clavata]